MKKFSLIVLASSLAACGGNNGTDIAAAGASNVTAAQSQTVSAADASSTVMDSTQFLINAYRDGLAEIKLSQLALQKSSNDEVRTFAQTMIDHHTAVNKELSRLAQNKGITLPTDLSEDQNSDVTRLSALSGDAFDRAYMQLNVSTHDKDAADARRQGQQGTDADIKKLANALLPLLEIHLAAAEEISSVLDPNAFLTVAYQDGLAEIQLSRLALQKSTNTDVKNFAQKMINDHTQANLRISGLAQKSGLTLQTTLSPNRQSIADELSTLSGSDFDKAYMDVNVIVHKKDVRLFRRQSEEGKNADVKSFAQNLLPTLSQHLEMAQSIDNAIQPSSESDAQDNLTAIRLAQLALLKSVDWVSYHAYVKCTWSDWNNWVTQNKDTAAKFAQQGLEIANTAIKTYAPEAVGAWNSHLPQIQVYIQQWRGR